MERQHHIGIPALMSNRVAAIADFNQEVARAAGAFRAPGVVDLLQRPTAARFTDRKLGEGAFRSATEAATVVLSSSREGARLEFKSGVRTLRLAATPSRRRVSSGLITRGIFWGLWM